MLRDTALKTKRLELGNCVGARKRKLSELYHVAATVAASVTASLQQSNAQSSPRNPPRISEAEFQDENDITQGKRFSVATLRKVPGGDSEFSLNPSADQELDSRIAKDGFASIGGGIGAQHGGSSDTARAKDEKRALQDITDGASLPRTPSQDPSSRAAGVKEASSRTPLSLANGAAQSIPDASDGTKAARVGDQEGARQKPFAQQDGEGPERSEVDTQSDIKRPPDGKLDGTIASRRGIGEGQGLVHDDNTHETLSNQKPSMRIDTAVSRSHPLVDSSTPSSSFTPLRSAQGAMQSSPPERMTTRVSSGALRHKSVSEILGETPKLSPSQGERMAVQDLTREESALVIRRESFVASPESATFKSRPAEIKDRDKDRSKLSTVVFARQQLSEGSRRGESVASQLPRKDKSDENKDYLVPLFAAQAVAQNPTLNHLISSAHKTLTTANHYIDYHESQDCRILKRIYHLQNSNRWSLRQLERSAEPPRPNTHWDTLLGEVKWMRTDFREERKWKLTAAKNLAEWCAEWVAASPEDRSDLQVKLRPARKPTPAAVESQATPSSSNIQQDAMQLDSTPDLIHSMDDTSENGEEDLHHPELVRALAPAALFSLSPDEVSFNLDKTPIADKLLGELPLYQPFMNRQKADKPWSEILDASWQKPIVPVSKHAIGKIVVRDDGPRRKRSRYDYSPDDDSDEITSSLLNSSVPKNSQLPPDQHDVALFDPKNKHIVDRLHAGHAFRPPSQHPMPSQQFFECRYPSQWTTAEDDELRKLVREYEYNWNAISDFLSSPSLFSSGAERRTPWECFERWESFEGLPGEMDKHSYFRAWRSRKQNARQRLEQGFLLQQQNAANPQILRRRSAEPVHVERRKSDKHYALIGAISKVAKKRENHLQKQQHAAQIAAIRKQPETAQPRLRMQTPQEFSAHKHKQEMEFKEKQMLYRQHMENARRNAMQQQKAAQQAVHQQQQQQQQQQAVGLGVPPQARMGVPMQVNGTSPRPNSSLGQPMAQVGNRAFSSPQQGMMNGMIPNGAPVPVNRQAAMMGAGGMNVPQAQMQAFLQAHQSALAAQNGQEANRVMSEAMRVQEQQRLMQRQVRGQPNGHNPMGAMANGVGMTHQQQLQQNAALLGNMQQAAKMNALNGMTPGQQRSAVGAAMANSAQAQQLSGGVVPLLNQISTQLKQMHPNASPEQIKQMATQSLNQHLRNQNAQATNGMGAGGAGAMQGFPQQAMNFSNTGMSPQMYQQFLRSQQASQQSRQNAAPSTGAGSSGGSNSADPNASSRPGSRGTPGSQSRGSVAAKGASSSPHPPQAQLAGSPS